MNGKILIKNNGYDTANNILISYGFETDDQKTKLYLSPG